jgi:hypothetical protein
MPAGNVVGKRDGVARGHKHILGERAGKARAYERIIFTERIIARRAIRAFFAGDERRARDPAAYL